MKLPLTLLFALTLLIAACGSPSGSISTDTSSTDTSSTGVSGAPNNQNTGALSFVANGEDFVRQGFVSKDNWLINFEHVYLTLDGITAYQTDPPYDATSGAHPEGAAVTVAGPITLDLAEGDENAAPILLTKFDAEPGHYNALSWRMIPAASADIGDIAGTTILMIGKATKDGQSVEFRLSDATEYSYSCGEFVGDTRNGIVAADADAQIEATFHFDHLFGDADLPADDSLNLGALGFGPLADLAEQSQLETTVANLANQLGTEDYSKLVKALSGLGHVGEGHCYEATGGYTGSEQR